MKLKPFKHIFTVFVLAASISVTAQKQNKKYTEKFNVNKNVKVEINASHAEIDVTTWNKNEVLVEAFLEIEGLTKKEAEKYLKNYKFEALGNSSKVSITAGGNNSYRFGDNDFVVFNGNFQLPEIVIPDFEMPEIIIPDFELPNINFEMPDFDFDFNFDFEEFMEEGHEYSMTWRNNGKKIVIKSKQEWEDFKKTKDYKDWKKEMKEGKEKLKKELAKIKIDNKHFNKKLIQESLAKARAAIKEIDMDEMRKDLAKMGKDFNKNFSNNFIFDSDSDELTINGKKVKVTKKIMIKVPKGATFDLNTRHCKVKLPKGKASGKVSYGSFNSKGLTGGKLKIINSPVNIASLNTSTLFLKNTTDATIASVVNSELNLDYSNLKIEEAFFNTDIIASFGEIEIAKLTPTSGKFTMTLDQSEAKINIKSLKDEIKIIKTGSVITDKNSKNKGYTLTGKFLVETKGENLKISGKYSELTFIK